MIDPPAEPQFLNEPCCSLRRQRDGMIGVPVRCKRKSWILRELRQFRGGDGYLQKIKIEISAICSVMGDYNSVLRPSGLSSQRQSD